jgi:GH35 family endo-1,4-beta-xylanase
MKEKKEKKYRKILTPEQYMKWESFEAERDFRRMRERPE